MLSIKVKGALNVEELSRLDRLRRVGVSSEQLEKANSEYPEPQPIIQFDTRDMIDVGEILIPVHKIKSLGGRSNESMSWLGNFLHNGNYRQIGTTRGFVALLSSIEKNGLQPFIESFQVPQSDQITATYFRELDQYVVDEGKHRATFAKVIGMKTIMAKVVQIESPKEIRRFLAYKEKRQEIRKIIADLGLKSDAQKKLGIMKEEEILLIYNNTHIGSFIQHEDYWNGESEIERNLTAMRQLQHNVNTLQKINWLPFNLPQVFYTFFLKGKNNALANYLIEKLLASGYFAK